MKQLLKLKRNFWLLLFPLSVIIMFVAKRSTFIAEEFFAKRIYHIYSIVVSRITGIFPLSIGELLLVLMPFIVTFLIVRLILHIIREKGERKVVVVRATINTLCTFSILYFIYTIGCGVNYYRYSISYYLDLQIQESTEKELFELSNSLAQRANSLRKLTTKEDEYGVFQLSMSESELGEETLKAYAKIAENYPILSGWYPKAKPLLLSNLMSRMQLTGIFFPFTMEANVNVAAPDYTIPATMSHEMAHQRGFMREDEANYIAYLVCVNSDNVDLQYSGIMQALVIVGNALYDRNAELYREVSETYQIDVRKDLNANSKYWRQFENQTLSNTVEQINNTYLKMNDQEDGVQSYGRMVDLLLAEFRSIKQ